MHYKILLAVIIVGIGWVYTFITYGMPTDWRRRSGVICPVVRMAAFIILAGFIINPGFSWIRKVNDEYPYYIVDASGSMGITDADDRSRFHRALMFFPGESTIVAADSVRVMSSRADSSSFSFAPRTDLGTMIQQAVSLKPQARRFIIASDGIHNTGRDPVQTARLFSREISCVFIDNSGEPADARIEYLTMPSLIFPEQECVVRAIGTYSGPDSSQSTTARLVINGRVAETKPLVLTPDSSTSVSFQVTFDTPGLSSVAVNLDSLPDERITENNKAARTIEVRRRYRTCEIFSSRPLHDVAFLHQALQSDGGFEVYRSIRNLNMAESFSDSIPDILVLGIYDDIPVRDWYERSVTVLRRGGVVVLLGWPQEDPWSEISPLWCRDVSARDGHVLTSNTIGRSVSVLFGLSNGVRRPPQRVPGGTVQISPRAEIVGTADGTPVIAVHPWQRGYVLTWLGSDWWRSMLRRDDTDTVNWPGILRWLLTPKGRGRLRIHTGTGPLEAGVPLMIRLEAFSRGWEPTPHGDALISIGNQSDSVVTYKRIRLSGTGPVAVQFPPVPSGTWIISAEAILEGADTLRAEKTVKIRDISREFIRTVPDPTILKRMAAENGGVFMSLEDSSRMDSLVSWRSDQFEREFIRFRAFWPAFILFVILLSVEWWLRHRQGLP